MPHGVAKKPKKNKDTFSGNVYVSEYPLFKQNRSDKNLVWVLIILKCLLREAWPALPTQPQLHGDGREVFIDHSTSGLEQGRDRQNLNVFL